MKREKILSWLIPIFLSAGIAIGGISCMITAFAFASYDIIWIVLFSLIFSAVTVGVVHLLRNNNSWMLIFIGILLVIPLIVVFSTKVRLAFEAMIYQISNYYGRAYGFVPIGSGLAKLPGTPETWAFCLIAVIVILVQLWNFFSGKGAVVAVLVGLLPLISCLVVMDTIPGIAPLLLLLSCIFLLIITNFTRRRSEKEGNRLAAMLLIPVCFVSALMFAITPKDGQRVEYADLHQMMSNWFESLPFVPELGEGSGGSSGLPVATKLKFDLSTVGKQSLNDNPVMNIESPISGYLYLRGQAYDVYTGDSWAVVDDDTPEAGWPNVQMDQRGFLRITTLSEYPYRFFPYYIDGTWWIDSYVDGMLNNPDGLKEYLFYLAEPTSTSSLSVEQKLNFDQRDRNLALPDDTAEWAKHKVAEILGDESVMTMTEKVERIAGYVTDSAVYDQNTGRMPRFGRDFAKWFLEDSDTGYCVHFATATVVLLRAAGIPARYVTGYLTWVQKGEIREVTQANAHAWVEYYDSSNGWTVLEATPSDGLPDDSYVTEPPEITVPSDPQTTEPSQPTEPEDTSVPQDTTIGPVMPTFPENPNTSVPPTTNQVPVGKPDKMLDRTLLLSILKWVLRVVGVAAFLLTQRILRKYLRWRKMYTGSPNRCALARWREVKRLCRVLRKRPPQHLLDLAEKAKFSQHRLNPRELMQFELWISAAIAEIEKKPAKILYKLILAI